MEYSCPPHFMMTDTDMAHTVLFTHMHDAAAHAQTFVHTPAVVSSRTKKTSTPSGEEGSKGKISAEVFSDSVTALGKTRKLLKQLETKQLTSLIWLF